ncbi:MAG: copper ion binding protein, partial [Thermodesulfobacteriota bacterium]
MDRALKRDPICGMEVDPAKAAGQSTYKNSTYYFCNIRCKERFDSDPEAALVPEGKPEPAEKGSPNEKTERAILPLKGMSCASCAHKIEKALQGIDGVAQASVNFAAEKATVDYDPSQIKETDLAKAVESAGYSVVGKREVAMITIGGMSCASCAQKIEKNLSKEKGIAEASVNFASQTAMVRYDSAIMSREDIEKVIEATGYEVIKTSGEKTVEIKVIGMGSDHCAGVVKKAVERLEGVRDVETNDPNLSA